MPKIATDAIIEINNQVLMIRRGGSTYHDYLAFPGGFVERGETVEIAMIREVKEELNLNAVPISILGVYSDPKRDPRRHVISVIFVIEVSGNPKAGDDASAFEWIDIMNPPYDEFAFDHSQIFMDYLHWRSNRKQTYWSLKKPTNVI